MLKYLLFWFVFNVLGRLPLPVLYRIADVVGAVSYRLAPAARANVWDNLRHVMPDAPKSRMRKAAKQVFRNVAYYYADFAHLPRMDPKQFYDKRLVTHGLHELLLPHLATGQGAVMLSAHMGNPELTAQGLVALGVPLFAVTEPIEPPRLSRLLNRVRSSQGLEFVPVGVAAAKRIMRSLRSGGVVALMGDRDIEGPRMRLPLFGEETWMPTGPIEVGLRTGAAIFPTFCPRRGRYKIEVFIEEPIETERTDDFEADVRAAALKWIARYEEHLRREPEQWFVLERLWEGPTSPPRPEQGNRGTGEHEVREVSGDGREAGEKVAR